MLVLVVAFGGPLVGRLESLAASPLGKWRRSHWIGLALLLAAVLLALTGSSGGQGALVLALLPVAWVLVTDRSILQGSKEDERASVQEPLTLSRAADEAESSAQTDAKLDRDEAAAEPPERLVGGELLAKIKELGDVGKSDLVRACGYFSQRPDGSERLNFTGFYEALLEAKGIETSSSNSDNEDEEEPAINYDDLWAYFQDGGGDIWNEEVTVYLGTFEGEQDNYIIEINGPDEYDIPYCTSREDLPRIVDAFIEHGGSISVLQKAICISQERGENITLSRDEETRLTTKVTIRFAMTKGEGGDIVIDRLFKGIIDSSELNLVFEPDILSVDDAQIINVLVHYNGVSRSSHHDCGWWIEDDELVGHPSPIVTFTLNKPVDPEEFKRSIWTSSVSFVTTTMWDHEMEPYIAEDHNGYTSIIEDQQALDEYLEDISDVANIPPMEIELLDGYLQPYGFEVAMSEITRNRLKLSSNDGSRFNRPDDDYNKDISSSPQASADEPQIMTKESPDEVLENLLLKEALKGDASVISNLSGEERLSLLKSEDCPPEIANLFELGRVNILGVENYSGESHFYDYDLDGTTVRIQGVSEGCEWSELILSSTLVPYFISTLQDEVDGGYGQWPSTSALISAAVHHSSEIEIGDSGKSKVSYVPPEFADEAVARLDDGDFSIKRDLDDPYWESVNNEKVENLRSLSERFFASYDNNELDYWPEDDYNVKRHWEYDSVEGFEIKIKSNPDSTVFVSGTENDLGLIFAKLSRGTPQSIGLLIHMPLGCCGEYGYFESIETPDNIEDSPNIDSLLTQISGTDITERVVERLADLGEKIIESSSILGINDPDTIEVLVQPARSQYLFGEVVYYGSNSNSDHDNRFLLNDNLWMPLRDLIYSIKHDSNIQRRLLFSVLTTEVEDFNFRAKAEIPFIKGSAGCEFSSEVDMDLELIQCTRMNGDKSFTVLQGFDHGEFETGIMNCGYSGGVYTHTHTSLGGTIWDGLFSDKTS